MIFYMAMSIKVWKRWIDWQYFRIDPDADYKLHPPLLHHKQPTWEGKSEDNICEDSNVKNKSEEKQGLKDLATLRRVGNQK